MIRYLLITCYVLFAEIAGVLSIAGLFYLYEKVLDSRANTK